MGPTRGVGGRERSGSFLGNPFRGFQKRRMPRIRQRGRTNNQNLSVGRWGPTSSEIRWPKQTYTNLWNKSAPTRIRSVCSPQWCKSRQRYVVQGISVGISVPKFRPSSVHLSPHPRSVGSGNNKARPGPAGVRSPGNVLGVGVGGGGTKPAVSGNPVMQLRQRNHRSSNGEGVETQHLWLGIATVVSGGSTVCRGTQYSGKITTIQYARYLLKSPTRHPRTPFKWPVESCHWWGKVVGPFCRSSQSNHE